MEAHKARLLRLGAPVCGPFPSRVVQTESGIVEELKQKLLQREAVIQELSQTIFNQRALIARFADESEMPIPRINDILIVVGDHYNTTKAMLIGNQRTATIVQPRWVAYYLCRKHGYSLTVVGREMHKDHTSVLHGSRKIEAQVADGSPIAGHLDLIEGNLRSYIARRIEAASAALK